MRQSGRWTIGQRVQVETERQIERQRNIYTNRVMRKKSRQRPNKKREVAVTVSTLPCEIYAQIQ